MLVIRSSCSLLVEESLAVDGAVVQPSFDATASVHVAMDVRFENRPNYFIDFLQASHVTKDANERLMSADYYNSGQIDAWNFAPEQIEFVNATIEKETWYHVDFSATSSATDGSVSVMSAFWRDPGGRRYPIAKRVPRVTLDATHCDLAARAKRAKELRLP